MKKSILIITVFVMGFLSLNASSIFAQTQKKLNIVKKGFIRISMAGDQGSPSVISLSDDSFLLTYRQDTIPDEYGDEVTYGRIFDINGNAQGDKFLIDGFENYMEIAALNNGNFVTVGDGLLNDEAILPMDIAAKIYDFEGKAISNYLTVIELDRDSDSFYPFVMLHDVCSLNNNEFLVTWTKNYLGFFLGQARIIDINGNPKSNTFSVSATSSMKTGGGEISVLPNKNRFVIAFEDYDSDEDPDGGAIRAGYFYSNGNSIGGDFMVNSTTKGDQIFPKTSALSNGNCVIVWRDTSGIESPITGSDVRGQILASDGVRIGNEFLVNITTENNQWSQDVFALDNGDFAVIWKDDSYSPDNSSEGSIKGRIFASDGSSSGDEFLVNASGNQVSQPAGAYLGNNRFVIFWESDSDIYGQLYDVDGDSGNCYFTHIASNDKWETEIAVINKNNQELSGTFEAYSSEGIKLSEKELTISENGRRALTVGDEFPNPGDIGYIIDLCR